jgi:hypothetical protein
MNIQDLQDQLRLHIRMRIGRRELTGSGLAHEAGFPQGHLSNFLNQRRGLSTESIDRLLAALGIGLLDLMNVQDIQRRAVLPSSDRGEEMVAIVAPENAALARFTAPQVLDRLSFSKSFLRRLKSDDVEGRGDWLRFVVVRGEAHLGLDRGAARRSHAHLLIDRHYNSLHPYRRRQRNVYLASFSGQCRVGDLSLLDDHLVLRPHEREQAVEGVRIERGRTYSGYVIGRVCHVGQEV